MSTDISLTKLSLWQQTAYAAALLERMLPNYKMFSQAVDFGEPAILRNQLDLIWQRLEQGQLKINFTAQLEKLEDVIPDVEDFDFFGVYPALDTCMALGSLLQGIQDSDSDAIANVALLSEGSVSHYVGLILASEHEADEQIIIQEQDINEHPLTIWENDTQQELKRFLLDNKENKTTCQSLKKLALSEGLSNLGIEF